MNIKAICFDNIYRKMITTSYELIKPFEFKWQCVGIPLKAEPMG